MEIWLNENTWLLIDWDGVISIDVSSTLYYWYLVTVIVKFRRYCIPWLINVLRNYPFHTCNCRYKHVHQQTTIGIIHLWKLTCDTTTNQKGLHECTWEFVHVFLLQLFLSIFLYIFYICISMFTESEIFCLIVEDKIFLRS